MKSVYGKVAKSFSFLERHYNHRLKEVIVNYKTETVNLTVFYPYGRVQHFFVALATRVRNKYGKSIGYYTTFCDIQCFSGRISTLSFSGISSFQYDKYKLNIFASGLLLSDIALVCKEFSK